MRRSGAPAGSQRFARRRRWLLGWFAGWYLLFLIAFLIMIPV